MKKHLALLLVGLMVTTVASAVEVRGMTSCGVWIQDQSERNQIDGTYHKLWLIGFMSGLVVGTGKDVLKGTDNPSVYLWMDNYCKANPLKFIDEGGLSLFWELKKEKGL